MDSAVNRISNPKIAAAAAGIIGLNIRKILTGLTPKRYTVFNMVADNYLALGEA